MFLLLLSLEFHGNFSAGVSAGYPLSGGSALVETPYRFFVAREVGFSSSADLLIFHNFNGATVGASLNGYFNREGVFLNDVSVFYRKGISFRFGRLKFGNSLISFEDPWGVDVSNSLFDVSILRFASDTVFDRYALYLSANIKGSGYAVTPFLFGFTDVTSGLSELGSAAGDTYVVVTTDISGVLKKSITVDLSRYPFLRVGIARVGESDASWFIEVRRPGESFVVQPSTSSSGQFLYNVAAITGWKGITNFEIVFGVSDNQKDILTNPVVVKSLQFISSDDEVGWDFGGFSGWEKISVDTESLSSSEILSGEGFPYHLVPQNGAGGGLIAKFSGEDVSGDIGLAASESFTKFTSGIKFSRGAIEASLDASYLSGAMKYARFSRSRRTFDEGEYFDFPWFTSGAGGKFYGTYPVPSVNSTVFLDQGKIEYYCGQIDLSKFPFLCVEVELPDKSYRSSWALSIKAGDSSEVLLYEGSEDGFFCFDLTSKLDLGEGASPVYIYIRKSSYPLVLRKVFFSTFPYADTLDRTSLKASLSLGFVKDLPVELFYFCEAVPDFSSVDHLMLMKASYERSFGSFSAFGLISLWNSFSSLVPGSLRNLQDVFGSSGFLLGEMLGLLPSRSGSRMLWAGGLVFSFPDLFKNVSLLDLKGDFLGSAASGSSGVNLVMGSRMKLNALGIVSGDVVYFRNVSLGDSVQSEQKSEQKGRVSMGVSKEFKIPWGGTLLAGYEYRILLSSLWTSEITEDALLESEKAFILWSSSLAGTGTFTAGISLDSFPEGFIMNADLRFSLRW